MTLIIKTRPPGNNSSEIRTLLKAHLDKIIILDHAKVEPIKDNLAQIDIVVGCATNAVINTLLRGVSSIVYINALDKMKLERRSVERLPYENFGIPVVTEKQDLQLLLQSLSDKHERKVFLQYQKQQAALIYPNINGKPAVEVICSYIRKNFNHHH